MVAPDACQHCGECQPCREGRYNVCEKLAFTGLHNDGAFAPYVNVPAELCFIMEAIDICFLDERFDLVVLNGVVDCFPGYNYLRRVLDHAVERLTEGGSIFVGAVRDMDRKDDLRAAIRERALATGDQSALLRFEGSAELFVPRRFFSAWAAECPYPVEVKFSPAAASAPTANDQADAFRYDVHICRSAHASHQCIHRFALHCRRGGRMTGRAQLVVHLLPCTRAVLSRNSSASQHQPGSQKNFQ